MNAITKSDQYCGDDEVRYKTIAFPCGCAIRYISDDEYYRNTKCKLHKNMSNEKFWLTFIEPNLAKP